MTSSTRRPPILIGSMGHCIHLVLLARMARQMSTHGCPRVAHRPQASRLEPGPAMCMPWDMSRPWARLSGSAKLGDLGAWMGTGAGRLCCLRRSRPRSAEKDLGLLLLCLDRVGVGPDGRVWLAPWLVTLARYSATCCRVRGGLPARGECGSGCVVDLRLVLGLGSVLVARGECFMPRAALEWRESVLQRARTGDTSRSPTDGSGGSSAPADAEAGADLGAGSGSDGGCDGGVSALRAFSSLGDGLLVARVHGNANCSERLLAVDGVVVVVAADDVEACVAAEALDDPDSTSCSRSVLDVCACDCAGRSGFIPKVEIILFSPRGLVNTLYDEIKNCTPWVENFTYPSERCRCPYFAKTKSIRDH
ncbi:DNA ligase [Frankliniella fusca]|uniref:DNA ligase n=1 Tax=Frankliniella fusca TaxID=407009 RepID=A0AAE1HZZ3_9NEOP|nr:DNA ligase [Frankliniella fusca]